MNGYTSLTVVDSKDLNQVPDEVIRTHSKTFYFATSFLPPPQREAIRALYAFCRVTDDLVDQENACHEEIQNWRKQVNLYSSQQSHPILFTWAKIREKYSIDRKYEADLMDGVEMDLCVKSYATWDELQLYCYRVASTVGLLSIPIIGLAKGASFIQAAPYAIQLGIALQLTNILRDIGEDRRRGRVYLPIEDLNQFGLSVNDIRNEVFDHRFKGLMRFEIQRARNLYQQALPGIAFLAPSARIAVGAAAMIYRAILDEIEKIDYRVYQIRAHTTSLQKILLLPSILWRVSTLRHPV